MFKVQENKDGSTSIFCKATGKLICTIRAQNRPADNPRISRPVNTVEPSAKAMPPNLNNDIQSGFYTDRQDVKHNTRESKCCISPIPVYLEKEEKEDYSDDCITQDEFARCLNLIPKEKLDCNDIMKLKSEFPLRCLSRTRAFDIAKCLRDIKLHDDTPLTSSLGLKILQHNAHKSLISEQTVQEAIKKYDIFCRFPLNTAKLITGNFPKLRCREKKDFPVTAPQKIMKLGETHTYCFSRRQRLEKMITIKTGLNARSRRLHRLCLAKKAVVHIKRLAEDKIIKWTERQVQSSPPFVCSNYLKTSSSSESTDSDTETSTSDSETSTSDSDFHPNANKILQKKSSDKKVISSRVSSFKSNLAGPTNSKFQSDCSSQYLRFHLPEHFDIKHYENCFVKLTNVLEKVHKVVNTYLIKGTDISVPYFEDFWNTLRLESILKVNHKKTNCQLPVTRNDHAYHRPFSKQNSKNFHNVRISCYLDSSRKGKCRVKIKSKARSAIQKNVSSSSTPATMTLLKNTKNTLVSMQKKKRVKNVPIIDLTDENIPSPISKSQFSILSEKYSVSKWLFHCFGCGHKCLFFSESFMDTAVTEHMQIYHSVSDPESFLNSYFDSANQCAIIEAFPGYKISLGN